MLDLDRPGGGAWVRAVVAGGAAKRAGSVRAGDRLVAVDGRAVAGLPAGEVASLVRGTAGTAVRLTVRRAAAAGQPPPDVTATLVRSAPPPPPPPPPRDAAAEVWAGPSSIGSFFPAAPPPPAPRPTPLPRQ